MQHGFGKSWLKRLWCGITLLCSLAIAPALADRMAFHNILQSNTRAGLWLNGINHIVQDHQGFIWFGGDMGLARYDGRNTQVYQHDPDNPHSLAHDYVRGLAVDKQGVIWVATEAGLCQYQPLFDRFSCHPKYPEGHMPRSSIRSLAVDAKNAVYIGTYSGLYRISADRRSLAHYRIVQPDSPNGAPAVITAIEATADEGLWLGTDGEGLIHYQPETREARFFRANPSDPHALGYNKIQSLELDHQNRLWVATYGGGVSVLNPERTRFETHVYQAGEPGTLSSNVIWNVFQDSYKNIWLAVDQGGLVRYDEKEGFIATRHKPYDATSLVGDQVRSVFEDRNGDLWIGTFPTGVSFFNRATGYIDNFKHEPDDPGSLSHSAILSIHGDDDGRIWLGTEDGLNLYEPEQGRFVRYQLGGSSKLAAKAILSIEQFDPNTLWVGTWSGGLMAFDLTTRSFRPIDTSPADGSGTNSLFIWDILRDSQGNMWLADEFNGVTVYERDSGTFRYYRHDPDNRFSLPGNFVWSILEDHNGAFWIATVTGLGLLRPGETLPRRIATSPTSGDTLQSERLVALYEDSDRNIWIGTQDKGVFVYDPDTNKYRHLGLKHGLPSTTVSGFIEDGKGFVWILTTNGLAKVSRDDFSMEVVGIEAGLVGNNFNRNAAFRDKDGRLYLGGAEGLSIFHPDELITEYPAFPVWVTNLRVMNKEVVAGVEGSPLNQSILFTSNIELTHRDLMFAFDFSALNYRNHLDTRYAYKLEGFDRDWNHIGPTNTATYTNMAAGKYVFRVKASRGKDDWVESRGLHITLKPSPWQTYWAFVGYALGLGLLGYLFANYFRLHVRSKVYHSLSTTDALTGVANRMGLTQAAEAMFDALEKRQQSLCVLFLDIDHFKSINDLRGHDSGDRILIEVAQVFRQCLRQSDMIGRWGGEEFIIICSGVDATGGFGIAEKIRQRVAERAFDVQLAPLRVTVSVGVACARPDETFEGVAKRADEALYLAKQAGRNRVEMAAP